MYGDIALKLIIGMLGVLFFLRVSGKAQMPRSLRWIPSALS